MTNTPATAVLSGPWSEVRAGDRVMRYRRSGAGSTVLLLVDNDASPSTPPLSSALIRALCDRFRLIAPELPVGVNVTTWLAEFLEGLGTIEVTVLAAGQFCMPAIELAFRDMDPIKRLVLIPDGEPDDSTSEGALTTTVGTPQIPVLIVRPGVVVNQSLSLVTDFLAGV